MQTTVLCDHFQTWHTYNVLMKGVTLLISYGIKVSFCRIERGCPALQSSCCFSCRLLSAKEHLEIIISGVCVYIHLSGTCTFLVLPYVYALGMEFRDIEFFSFLWLCGRKTLTLVIVKLVLNITQFSFRTPFFYHLSFFKIIYFSFRMKKTSRVLENKTRFQSTKNDESG